MGRGNCARGDEQARQVRGLRCETGQMLVVFALLLPVLLGFCAITIDFGNLFAQKRSLQRTADAAALAGAQKLPCGGEPDIPAEIQCRAEAGALAASYSAANGGPSTLPACAGPSDTNCFEVIERVKMRVKLERTVATFFGGLFGRGSWDVSAKAAAVWMPYTSTTPGSPVINPGTTYPGTTVYTTSTSTTGGTSAIMFAKDTSCAAINLQGANSQFIGGVVSNGGVDGNSAGIGGDYLAWGNGVSDGCLRVNNLLWDPIVRQAPIDWPVPIPTCLPAGACVPGSNVTPTSVNGVACKSFPVDELQPGLYCSKDPIDPPALSGFAYAAPSITANGTYVGSSQIYPEYGGMLFFAYDSGNNVVKTSGGGLEFRGAIFAPNGQVQLTGSGSSGICLGVAGGCGFVEALTISLSGSNARWKGLGPRVGGTVSTTSTPVTTTQGTTVDGTTTTNPDVVTTVGTGSNLDE